MDVARNSKQELVYAFTIEQWKMFFSVLKKNIGRASPVYYKFIVDMETQIFIE
jgi:hypothetical protein